MRAVVARVSSASVSVDDRIVGRLEKPGLLALLGIHRDDEQAAAGIMARKLHELRVLEGEESCASSGAPLLVVSQFTLYASTRKGRRPSFLEAASGKQARGLYEAVVTSLRGRGAQVETGKFGALMQVSSVNSGPFTVIVEA